MKWSSQIIQLAKFLNEVSINETISPDKQTVYSYKHHKNDFWDRMLLFEKSDLITINNNSGNASIRLTLTGDFLRIILNRVVLEMSVVDAIES